MGLEGLQIKRFAGRVVLAQDAFAFFVVVDGFEKELEAVTKSNVDAIDEALARKEAELLEV